MWAKLSVKKQKILKARLKRELGEIKNEKEIDELEKQLQEKDQKIINDIKEKLKIKHKKDQEEEKTPEEIIDLKAQEKAKQAVVKGAWKDLTKNND